MRTLDPATIDAATARLDEAVSILQAFIAAEDECTTSSGRGMGMYSDAMTRARDLMAPLARATAPNLATLCGAMFEGVVKALVEWASVRGFIDADDALLAPVVALARRAVKASNGADGIDVGTVEATAPITLVDVSIQTLNAHWLACVHVPDLVSHGIDFAEVCIDSADDEKSVAYFTSNRRPEAVAFLRRLAATANAFADHVAARAVEAVKP